MICGKHGLIHPSEKIKLGGVALYVYPHISLAARKSTRKSFCFHDAASPSSWRRQKDNPHKHFRASDNILSLLFFPAYAFPQFSAKHLSNARSQTAFFLTFGFLKILPRATTRQGVLNADKSSRGLAAVTRKSALFPASIRPVSALIPAISALRRSRYKGRTRGSPPHICGNTAILSTYRNA